MRETKERSIAVDNALQQLRRALIAEEIAKHPEIAGGSPLVRRVVSGSWDRRDADCWVWTFQPFTVCQPRILTISHADGWTVRSIRIGDQWVTRDVDTSCFAPLPAVFGQLDPEVARLPATTIGDLREIMATIDRWFEQLENLPRMTVQPGIVMRVELEPPPRCGRLSSHHAAATHDELWCQLRPGHEGPHDTADTREAPPVLSLHIAQLRDR